MKERSGALTAVLFAISVITGILTVICILLLPAEISAPEKPAHENINGVGYSDYPQNKGLLCCAEDGSGAFIYFNFKDISTHCYLFESDAEKQAEKIPYIKDYTLYVDNEFLSAFCDRLGGIEMADENGEKGLFYSAAISAFCQNDLSYEQRLQLCISFFEKIAKTGLSSEDFMFIIEETNTNLSYSVCYDWIPHIKEMFCNYIF